MIYILATGQESYELLFFLIPKMMSIFTLGNCLLLKRIAAYLLLWLEESLQMN